MRIKSNWLPLALLSLLGAGILTVPGCGRKPAAQEGPVGLPVEVAQAKLTEMSRQVLLTGTIKPRQEASITTNLPDPVVAVTVREGDRVKAGQIVAQLDPVSAQARLQQATGAVASAQAQAASAEAGYEVTKVSAPSQLKEAQAALVAASKRLEVMRAGARSQERAVARNAVAAAKSSLEKATLDLQRAEQLYQEGAVAREQVDSARNQYEQAKAQYESAQEQYNLVEAGARSEEIEAAAAGVRQAQAAVDTARAGLRQVEISRLAVQNARAGQAQAEAALAGARNDMNHTMLRAPIAGVIYAKMVNVGDVPGMGSTVMKVAALEQVYFEAIVPEKEFAALSMGQSVTVTVDALPGQSFSGNLERLVPVASEQSHDFMARIAVANPGLRLRPGMFARGSVLVERHPNAIVVPNEALLGQPGSQTVFVVASDRAESRKVVTGLQDATQTEIISGLKAGDKVVVAGQQGLTNGQQVSVTRRQ